MSSERMTDEEFEYLSGNVIHRSSESPVGLIKAEARRARARELELEKAYLQSQRALGDILIQYQGTMLIAYGRDTDKDGNPFVKAARAALARDPSSKP